MNINLGPPKLTDLKPRITVIGIGGAGCNAINNMIATQLDGVEFVVANTDAQSLAMSNAEHRIQLGANLTEGLGAGARPEVGEAAAREAEEDIRAEITGSHMVFIAAGMGGGTGTGAAAVIAEIARDLGILTVGIVSKPFQFEGARRMRTADAGIDVLEKVVDTLIVIPNQNLFRIANERTTFAEAFRLADQVLYSGIACIVDLIVKEGLINLDFADVQAVMKGMGTAMMGTGEATGEDRALMAANEAIANPLLDNITLSGAQGLLISIVGGSDLTLYEVDTAASHIRKEVAGDANIIVGATTEEGMNDRIRVSIVASGMMGAKSAQSHSAAAPNFHQLTPSPVQNPPHVPASNPRPPGDAPSAGPDAPSASLGYSTDDLAETNSASQAPRDPSALKSGASEMAAREADEFARALSEAMKATPSSSTVGDSHAGWQSTEGVVVEEGITDIRRSVAPPPLPEPGSANQFDSAQTTDGFEPAPPKQVRRSMPRILDVRDFPEVAQREYFAKMGAAQQNAVSARSQTAQTHSTESEDPRNQQPKQAQPRSSAPSPAAPAERPSLLRRLTGAGRR
jgi:cell division protein FtsZ